MRLIKSHGKKQPAKKSITRAQLSAAARLLAVCAALLIPPSGGIVTNADAYTLQWSTHSIPSPTTGSSIDCLAVDQGGYVWFNLTAPNEPDAGGLFVLDKMNQYVQPLSRDDGLANESVAAIAFEAAEQDDPGGGAIWVGTADGVSVIDRSGVITRLTAKNSPLPRGSVRTLHIARDGTKWLSVWGKGVSCVDREFNWAHHTSADGLCSDYIAAIQEDRQGTLWFGSRNRGISRLDLQGNWRHFSSDNSGLISNNVIHIAEESSNRLWFLTPEGASVFDGQNWMSYTPRNSPIGNAPTTSLVIDAAGNKWIGTDGAGLFKLDNFGTWSAFTTQNSQLPSDSILQLAMDTDGTLWIATPVALASAGAGSRAAAAGAGQFHEPVSPALGEGLFHPFEQGLLWENIGDSDLSPELSFALPSFPFGGKAWYYGALWADQEFSFNTLQYKLIADRSGAERIVFSGTFSQALFLISGGTLSKNPSAETSSGSCPFPAQLPDEVLPYLMPGDHIPSSDPALIELAHSLVLPASQGDMFKTLRDIVYSKLMQRLQLDDTAIGLCASGERGEEHAKICATRDVYYVLKHNRGGAHAKARLLCTLVRAAGIPARLIMDISGGTWCQAWLPRQGWISIESRYPIFDFLKPLRTYLPKVLLPSEHAVAALSGKNDDIGTVKWNPHLKGYFKTTDPAELRQPSQLRNAKVLLTTISSESPVPQRAKIPLADNIFVSAVQRGSTLFLVFEDGPGRELQAADLSLQGLSCAVNVRDTLFWRFIPRRLGNMLLIETIDCKTRLTAEAHPARTPVPPGGTLQAD